MPRGVAKAKDGVEKKGKEVGKVVVGKRSRKMRGGGNFNDYCNKFIMRYGNKFVNAKKHIIETFEKLKTIIGNFKPVPKLQIQDSDEKRGKKSALEKIERILKKKETKYIIDAINNDELKDLLAYISTNETKIKDIINEDEDEDIIDRLCKDILFIKIYKLFTEFLDISTSVTKIYSIQIATKKEDDIQQDREAHTRQSSIKSSGSEITLNRSEEQLNPNDILNADNVVGNWFDPQTIQDRENEQRITSTKRSKIFTRKSKRFTKKTLQPNRASVIQQKGDLLQGDASRVNVSSSHEPIQSESSNPDVSDDESEDDFDIVGGAKSTLMELILENTKKAKDSSKYKKFEEIKNNLNEDDEFEKYIKKVLNDLLFQKINDILDLLDSRDHTKEKIEDFLLRVDDETIREETKEYNQYINQSFQEIEKRIKDSKREHINNAKDELIRLFSIFRPEIKNYIQLLGSQTEPDDTNGSNISQESPVLLGILNPLNSPPSTLTTLPPLKGADSSFSSKLVINGSNQKKIVVSEKLKERYEKDMLNIDNILREKDTYLDQQNIKQRVIVLFQNIIIMAFKILNFKKITEIGKELSILENYTNTSSNLIFSDMNRQVPLYYSNHEKENFTIIKTTTKINSLQVLFNNFQIFCYDKLNILYKNNETDKIWEAEGGQPQKQPTAKEPKPKEPTKTPKAMKLAKEPNAKKPTKTPKPMKLAKEPNAKKPTKTPKPKEPTKTPKPKEPKNNKPKEPKNNKPKEPTKK